MNYEQQVWVAHQTPISAERLNHMEAGIASRLGKAGHPAGKYLGTDENGNVVARSIDDIRSDVGAGIKSISQKETSTVDGGSNIIAVELTDGTVPMGRGAWRAGFHGVASKESKTTE